MEGKTRLVTTTIVIIVVGLAATASEVYVMIFFDPASTVMIAGFGALAMFLLPTCKLEAKKDEDREESQ